MNKLAGIALTVLALNASAACSVSDIRIKQVRAKFVDGCGPGDCIHMQGTAVLINGCKEAVGIQIKVTAYDGRGGPVQTRDSWPASVRNIPPGEYVFSLDHWLRYDKSIKTFEVSPIDVRRWN